MHRRCNGAASALRAVFKNQNPLYAFNMATEIELKAHVKDTEAIKRLLYEKAAFLWEFIKEDSYWYRETGPGIPGPRFRLRREKLVLPDGSEKSSCLLTYKTKTLRDGIEINNEREFEIAAKEGSAETVFEEFLGRVGLKPDYSKKKKGWAFNYKGINAELCEVEGLGWFMELEILIEGAGSGEKLYAESRSRLLELLNNLGIEKKAIESRFYSEMLKGR